MRDIAPIWDGDTAPARKIRLMDGGIVRDTNGVVFRWDIMDDVGALVATRPGGLIAPKFDGMVVVYLRGLETDWDGVGKTLLAVPRMLVPTSPDGSTAPNMLSGSPGFDSDLNLDGVCDGWSKTNSVGVYSMVAEGDPPKAIFGNTQKVVVATAAGVDNFDQSVASVGSPGDQYTFGLWYRVSGVSGTKDNSNALKIVTDSSPVDDATVQLEVGDTDWRFAYVTTTLTVAHSSFTPRVYITGHSGTWQFDEANFFKGTYKQQGGEVSRIIVKPRTRIAKTGGNLLAGIGSFERDSDGNGVPDGWTRTGSAATISLDQTPSNVYAGSKALKVVPTGGAQHQALTAIKRGNFKAGETWRATVRYKNSGTVSGTPASPAFCLVLETDHFGDGPFQATVTPFSTTSSSSYSLVAADLVLTGPSSLLRVHIRFAEISGSTLWFDDVQLTRL